MTQNFECASSQVFSFGEIDRLWVTWQDHAPSFNVEVGKFPDHAYLSLGEGLPIVPNFLSLRVPEIEVEGYLSSRMDPRRAFTAVLSAASDVLPMICQVGFEETASKQSKRGYDVLEIGKNARIRRFIGYSANGSRVMTDAFYAREFFGKLIDKLSLPMRIETRGQDYFLSHTDHSMELWTSYHGLKGESPRIFWCEVAWDDRTLVDRMFEALEFAATQKRFDVKWHTSASVKPGTVEEDNATTLEFYRRLLDLHLPAGRHEIQLSFVLTGIAGIETLRQMCGPEDECYLSLCTFAVSPREVGKVGLKVTKKGHRILFESPMPVEMEWLQEQLGVEFGQTN